MNRLDRRQFGRAAAIAAAAIATDWSDHPALAQETLEPLNRFPRMMQEFLVRSVRACHRRSILAKAR